MDKYTAELLSFKNGGMPPKTKKYFRSTESGAGMTQKGVEKYRNLKLTCFSLFGYKKGPI